MIKAIDLYEYLKEHHNGKENGINRALLEEKLNMSEMELKALRRKINESEDIDGIVSTTKKIYLCKNDDEVRKSLKSTWRTAISLIKKARVMEKKLGLNHQVYYDHDVDEFKERVLYGDKL